MPRKSKQLNLHRKAVHLAVVAAIPTLMLANTAYATCSGSVASPYSTSITEFCTGSDGSLTNGANITSALSVSDSNNTLIQFEGLGKTLTNTGTISNNSTLATGATANRTRYGIFMGTATVGNTSLVGTTPGSGSAPTVGATTLNIGTGKASTVVGQTVTFGRFDSAAGDFFAGETKIITAYDSGTGIATLDSALSSAYFGSTGSSSLPIAYNVISGSGVNTINNQSSGVISASIGAAEIVTNISGAISRSNTSSAKAISMDIAGDYVINNAGTISATHAGVGGLTGIDGGGAVTSLVVNNSGTIAINRTSTLTLGTNTATSLTATTSTSGALSAQSIGSAAAVYSQEELQAITINNTGVIDATGNFTPAIYLRAGEQTIVNDGIIRTNTANGFAIGSVSDGGEIRTLDLTNNGTITGDILAVNGNAVRWYALSTLGTLNNRININNNWGQLDSTITNVGTITGNLYFSNGKHVLTNEDGATLTGNIDIDQRDTIASGQTPSADIGENTTGTTVVGTKSFTFENAGTFNGNVTIRTSSSTALGGDAVVSNITLIPTITGSGTGSSLASPSANIAGVGGTFNLITTDGGDHSNVTVAPKVATGAVVKDGQFFKVVDTYQIDSATVSAGATTVPNITNTNSLISWTAAVNASGNLVLESEVSTTGIAGLTGNANKALTALLGFDSDLGSQIQNLGSDEEISQAAEQLRPEINGANIQAAMGVTDRVFGLVDTHLGETHLASLTGKSGIATGEQPNGSGVWLQGFGFRGDQDKRKGVDGYTADAYGFAFGADTLVGAGNLRVGGAFSYGQSNIDDNGVNNGNKTDIDSYQATLYSSMLMDGWYLNGALGLGRHNYDSKRIVLTNTVTGSHDAWQYTAKVDAGWPMKAGSATITPVASLTYSRLDQDSYTESGIGALHIDDNDTNSFRSGLGAKALLPLHEGTVNAGLELRAIWNHEFANTAQDTTARFVGGSASFTTSGVEPSRDSANLGASLRLSGGDKDVQQSLLLSYDAEIKSQYLSHTALLQARFDF